MLWCVTRSMVKMKGKGCALKVGDDEGLLPAVRSRIRGMHVAGSGRVNLKILSYRDRKLMKVNAGRHVVDTLTLLFFWIKCDML